VFVSGNERSPQRVGDVPGRAAHVDDHTGPVGDDPADLTITRQPLERRAGAVPDVFGFDADVVDEVGMPGCGRGEVGDDAELGEAAPPGGAGVVS
jgi:hypothetical protein